MIIQKQYTDYGTWINTPTSYYTLIFQGCYHDVVLWKFANFQVHSKAYKLNIMHYVPSQKLASS